MAIKVADCHAMLEAAEAAERYLFIVKQNRFNPPVVAVKQQLDAGALGKIYSMQLNCFWHRDTDYYDDAWRGTQDLDGGTLFTQFSHFIDLMYWMLGDVKHLQAYRRNYQHPGVIDFEDTGVAILEFTSGAIGTLHYTVNSFEKNMEGSLTLFGEKGTVKIGGQYLNTLEYSSGIALHVPDGEDQANDYGTYTGSMSNHNKVYDDVIRVLGEDMKVATNAGAALKTVEIIERIYGLSDR